MSQYRYFSKANQMVADLKAQARRVRAEHPEFFATKWTEETRIDPKTKEETKVRVRTQPLAHAPTGRQLEILSKRYP